MYLWDASERGGSNDRERGFGLEGLRQTIVHYRLSEGKKAKSYCMATVHKRLGLTGWFICPRIITHPRLGVIL